MNCHTTINNITHHDRSAIYKDIQYEFLHLVLVAANFNYHNCSIYLYTCFRQQQAALAPDCFFDVHPTPHCLRSWSQKLVLWHGASEWFPFGYSRHLRPSEYDPTSILPAKQRVYLSCLAIWFVRSSLRDKSIACAFTCTNLFFKGTCSLLCSYLYMSVIFQI